MLIHLSRLEYFDADLVTSMTFLTQAPWPRLALFGCFLFATQVPINPALAQSGAGSRGPITVAVKEITNRVPDLPWWNSSTSQTLTTMLSNELQSSGHFTVVERQGMRQVLDEQELIDAGIVRPSTGPKKGMMTGAKYYVLGSVSDYQQNVETTSSSSGSSFLVGESASASGQQKSYVALDIRVVDTTTGEIAYSRTIEGTSTNSQKASGSSVGLPGLIGHSSSQSSTSRTPASRAIRAAMIQVADYLECVLYLKNECLSAFGARESTRRQRTKDALELY